MKKKFKQILAGTVFASAIFGCCSEESVEMMRKASDQKKLELAKLRQELNLLKEEFCAKGLIVENQVS